MQKNPNTQYLRFKIFTHTRTYTHTHSHTFTHAHTHTYTHTAMGTFKEIGETNTAVRVEDINALLQNNPNTQYLRYKIFSDWEVTRPDLDWNMVKGKSVSVDTHTHKYPYTYKHTNVYLNAIVHTHTYTHTHTRTHARRRDLCGKPRG